MLTCTRLLEFCAGHRVMGHENKCAHLHGHQYSVLATAQGAQDSIGRVIDFSVLKKRLGDWIEAHWDHGFLLCALDYEAIDLLGRFAPRAGERQKLHLMEQNPTAENIAKLLLSGVGPSVLQDTGVSLVEVTVWETPNCYATAKNENVHGQ